MQGERNAETLSHQLNEAIEARNKQRHPKTVPLLYLVFTVEHMPHRTGADAVVTESMKIRAQLFRLISQKQNLVAAFSRHLTKVIPSDNQKNRAMLTLRGSHSS